MSNDKTVLIRGNEKIKANLLKLKKVEIDEQNIEISPEIFINEKVKENGL